MKLEEQILEYEQALKEDEPFYLYMQEDKSKYPKASETINPTTGKFYIDKDDDFLVGSSGAFLLNISFKFIDTYLLRPAAIVYEKTNKYTQYKIDTLPYEQFRLEEEHRRLYGYTQPCKLLPDGTVENLTITGEHYNFINYGRIKKLDRKQIKAGNEAGKKYGFPEFFDIQYWYFKVKLFCSLNGFNNITLKSRRKGASYIEAIDSANIVNLLNDSIVIHAAFDKKYLTVANALTDMAKYQLNFYEYHTPFIRGALDKFNHSTGLPVTNESEIITGFKLKDNSIAGKNGTIFTVSTRNNPGVAVGKDGKRVKCDELNDFPNFTEFMSATNPAMRTGAFHTGMISAFGTAGVKVGNWDEFERHYYNTGTYDFMPFENVWDKNARDEVVGLFLPYWFGLEGIDEFGNWSIDDDGNTNYEVAKRVFIKEDLDKIRKVGKGRDFVLHKSMYANKPTEAFNSGSDRLLSSLELREHLQITKHSPDSKFYVDGAFTNTEDGTIFRSNKWLLTNGYDSFVHPYIEKVPFNKYEDFQGCFRMFYAPYTINGEIPKDLYFATYDPIGIEKTADDITDRNSLAVIMVWAYPNRYTGEGKKLMGVWAGRRDTHEDNDKIAINITKGYNAKMLAEMDRGNVKVNFTKHKVLKLLLPDPTEVTENRKLKTNRNRSYGMIIGEGHNKVDGIKYLKDLLYTRINVNESGFVKRFYHTLYDVPFLTEIDKFKLVGNYDRISCAILAAHQYNWYTISKLKTLSGNNIGNRTTKKLADILLNR